MTDTTHLSLPLMDAAQAQKHVTHNESLGLLDLLVQLSVVARDVAAPPGSPSEGGRYLVGASPSGAFAGHAGAVAAWQDGAWRFLAPQTGWLAFVAADSLLVVFNGTAWVAAATLIGPLSSLPALGIGTAADTGNPLSAKLNDALLTARSTGESGSGDLRLKLNKSGASNTVSQLYQTGYSGRAETGLTGDDHFRIKVSADGATWHDALLIDPSSGQVSFPSGVVLP